MKSITVHGIDDILERKLKEKSKEYKLSQSKTVKYLLEEALSIKEQEIRKNEFSSLFGRWSKEEQREFEERIKDMESIDDLDWQQ